MTYYGRYTMSTKRTRMLAGIVGIWIMAGIMTAHGGGNCIEMKNGYFWDPLTTNYWVPHGFGYQTINGNVFANQSKEQLSYDMLEMRKMHADSLRVDFTWGNIETANNVFDWTMTDHIVAEAERLGLRLFPLIGYQYAPTWSDSSWLAVNVSNQTTALLNYEHPLARAAYTDFLAHVTARYKDSKAIAGWILGNEYAYFDLWESNDPHLYVGYDTSYSLPSFRNYVSNLYAGSISALNGNWDTAYANFDAVLMPTNYPGNNDPNNVHLQNRNYPAYHDLIQWRKKSVGDFVAIGSAAVKAADTNHLRSYSMVGGIYSGLDANNTCEDAKTIVARCLAAGAGLDFWSINNYAWASQGNELRTAQYGITKYQDQSGLSVLVTETGHTSTETLFPGAKPRQPAALPGQVWEALISGALGVHIFTWNDRPMPQEREQGFGIVQTNRLIKSPVYWNIAETFRRMEQVNVNNLLGASRNPATDINFYWSSDADMVWGRANQENCMLWGGLKRLGYEPNFIDEGALDAGTYTNAPALLLSHAFMMQSNRVNALTNVIAAGVHIHANGVLPGRYNSYHKENPGWANRMSDVFGLNVTNGIGATNYWHGGISGGWDQPYHKITVQYLTTLSPLSPSYAFTNYVSWIWQDGIMVNSGTTIVNVAYDYYAWRTIPGLHINGHGTQGKAAINTWTLGDTLKMWYLTNAPPEYLPEELAWQLHYDWGRAIYRTWFGMIPQVDISGTGYFYVVPDYRTCTNGSVLISLLNESTNAVTITVTATNLMKGKTVERLSSAGGVLEANSDGVIDLTLAGDEYVLIYAYTNNESLVNPSAYKVWMANEPAGFWPNGRTVSTKVGYDTRGETLDLYLALESANPYTERASTNVLSVSGIGTNELSITAPDADLGNPNYISSPDGGQFRLHAWLQNGGSTVSECRLSTRMAWGAKPTSIPSSVTTGQTYDVTVNWQEMPSYKSSEYPTPLNRASLWQTSLSNAQPYTVFLDLMTGTVAVVSSNALTYSGTGSNRFSVTIPGLVATQFWWRARTVSGNYGGPTSNNNDVVDGFEDRGRGNKAMGELIAPWVAYAYAENNKCNLDDYGVGDQATQGTNGAFVVASISNAVAWGGFGMTWPYATTWALPPRSQWSNIVFSFHFKEAANYACTLQMKVEDTHDPAANISLHYEKAYGRSGWDTISARLSDFTLDAGFYTNSIAKITVNVQADTLGVQYVGDFDQIALTGTSWEVTGDGNTGNGDVRTSFEDLGQGPLTNPVPWTLNSYGDGTEQWLTHGIDGNASDGVNGHYAVYKSHTNLTGWSGFYLTYNFASPPLLPTTLSNAAFSVDFYENDGDICDIELQLKSAGGMSTYSRVYSGATWDTVRANLSQFSGSADMANLQSIVIVCIMRDTNVIYTGHFDNILFTGTVADVTTPLTNGLYLSINDSSSGTDTDHDGILDIYETDTGSWNGPTDTGTDPNDPDSDDDGMSDGDEVIAGTNPNVKSECFTMDSASNSTSDFVVEWFARTGRVYGVHYLDGSMATNTFNPLGTWTNIRVSADGWTNIVDTTAGGVPLRFYRVNVRQAP